MGFASLNIFLSLKPKTTAKGKIPNPVDEYLIMLDCNAGRQSRVRVYTGIRVYKKDWDEVKKTVKRTDSEWSLKNQTLTFLILKSKETAFRIMQAGDGKDRIQEWKSSMLEIVRPKPLSPVMIYDFEKEYFKLLTLQGSTITEGTRQVFKTAFKKLKEFCTLKSIPLHPASFTNDFMQGFLSFLYVHACLTDNTANKAISTLQNAMRKLMKTESFKASGIVVPPEFFEPIVRKRKADKVFLTPKELYAIMDYKPKSDRIQRIKDIFLFQCFTGLRYSDLSHLRPEDIKTTEIEGKVYRFIEKRQVKTQSLVKIPLVRQAEEILLRYSDHFPVPTNQKYNDYLKELTREAGITDIVRLTRYQGSKAIATSHEKWELIGTHTARHTTATIGLQLGIPAKVVQGTLGHSDLKMTLNYSHDDFDFNVKAMNEAFGKMDR